MESIQIFLSKELQSIENKQKKNTIKMFYNLHILLEKYFF